MQELSGGREGIIYQKGNYVIRPLNAWSASVHKLLSHLEREGFEGAPRFIGIEKDNEVLTFMQGDTFNYPLSGAITSKEAVISCATLLRKLHDATANSVLLNNVKQQWMLPSREPQEVICHGDFTPYNVALKGNRVVAAFDFDAAHPAPRIWDLAFSVYCWAPFKTDSVDRLGSLEQQIHRAKLFCDSYGATQIMREHLVEVMIQRLQALVDYMCQQASEGDKQFAENIEDEHHLSYLKDIHYLQENSALIYAGICD